MRALSPEERAFARRRFPDMAARIRKNFMLNVRAFRSLRRGDLGWAEGKHNAHRDARLEDFHQALNRLQGNLDTQNCHQAASEFSLAARLLGQVAAHVEAAGTPPVVSGLFRAARMRYAVLNKAFVGKCVR